MATKNTNPNPRKKGGKKADPTPADATTADANPTPADATPTPADNADANKSVAELVGDLAATASAVNTVPSVCERLLRETSLAFKPDACAAAITRLGWYTFGGDTPGQTCSSTLQKLAKADPATRNVWKVAKNTFCHRDAVETVCEKLGVATPADYPTPADADATDADADATDATPADAK